MEEDYLWNLSLSYEAVEGDYLSTGARALGDYLATLPQAKEEDPLFENCRSFVIRRGDYIHRLVVGKIMESDRYVWVAGDASPYRLVEHEGKTVLYLPPVVYKCTKKDTQTLSAIQLKAKMGKEACIRARADFVKAGLQNEVTYKDFDELNQTTRVLCRFNLFNFLPQKC